MNNLWMNLGCMIKKFVLSLLCTLVLGIGLVHLVWAAEPPESTTAVMAEGVVRKLDVNNRKLTIKHGPIANLNMSGMTMSFKAKAGVVLDDIKEGDAIVFSAVEENDQYVVTQLRKKQ
ncbi:MAG: copper-binding protein [Burkholderiales bacterium]|jgi:Cu/Ag efflux protein CusF|nr:copper-binding protein [Burkholderiales bacterium]